MHALFWIIPEQLAGRAGPDDEPWELPSLRAAGIGAVLSVNDGRMCDPDEFAALGMAYACFPLSDWVPPQPGDAEICLAALPQGHQFVQSQLAQGRRVLVHCSGGNDRTGLFLAYFLVHHAHISPDEAIHAVRVVRPTALGADGWDTFARQLLQDL
jgi:protein-tyrosine phosphatase